MPEPSDTDRIIAAHRDEARKTRSLLMWIFVGVPLISAAIGLFIYIAHTTGSPNGNDQQQQAVVATDTSVAPNPCVGHEGQAGYAWCGSTGPSVGSDCAALGSAAAYDPYCATTPPKPMTAGG